MRCKVCSCIRGWDHRRQCGSPCPYGGHHICFPLLKKRKRKTQKQKLEQNQVTADTLPATKSKKREVTLNAPAKRN